MNEEAPYSVEDLKKLFLIKLLHTAIWAFFASSIFYVLYCGVVDNISILTWIAIGCVLLEAFVLVIFGMYCPLTLIARKYSNSEKDNFDIFLPIWLARYNKQIFTAIFLLGLALVGFRLIQR